MTTGRSLVAAVLAMTLAGVRVAAGLNALGIITEADGAYLGGRHVSTGTTVYDGDRLATEPDGLLRLRSGAAMFYLPGDSQVTLRNEPSEEKGTLMDLTAGTLVFSTAQAAATEIRASKASIRPAADMPTVGQITAVAPKLLYVYARRNSLRFSYHDESEIIAEGESYRVVLDPTEDDTAAKPDSERPERKPRRRRSCSQVHCSSHRRALGKPLPALVFHPAPQRRGHSGSRPLCFRENGQRSQFLFGGP
jgi:hypothetical protein